MTKRSRQLSSNGKKIIAADRHHGGAWKVAYADFVTAMMAFFHVDVAVKRDERTTEKRDRRLF